MKRGRKSRRRKIVVLAKGPRRKWPMRMDPAKKKLVSVWETRILIEDRAALHAAIRAIQRVCPDFTRIPDALWNEFIRRAARCDCGIIPSPRRQFKGNKGKRRYCVDRCYRLSFMRDYRYRQRMKALTIRIKSEQIARAMRRAQKGMS